MRRAITGGAGTTETADAIQVLHVDDDPDFADMAATFIEREDDRFTVETATSASEGLAHLTDDVDCIVSDYDMSGRSGIQFLDAVREEFPNLPFILYTGKGSEEVASDAISAGVTDYLQKESGTEQYELLANRIVNAVDAYQSHQMLTERTRRLETLISTLPGMVYRCRNEPDWPMETVEGEVETLVGYSAETLESNEVKWGEVIHPDDRESIRNVVQDTLSEDGTFEVTYRIVTGDETTKWVWERGRGVYTDDGNPEALEGFITDISERKKYERRLEAITQAPTKEAVYLKDVDGRYQFINEAGASVFDREPAEVLGKRAAELYDSVEGDQLKVDKRVLENEEPVQYEVTRTVGENEHHFLAEKHPYYEDGELFGLVGISRDITERNEYEGKLQRQNERLDEFTSIVSHDLRNPLSVAQGQVDLVREKCDSEHLDLAARAHERMNVLIDDLLTLAREGEKAGDVESVDLASLTESCWRNVATTEVTLSTDVERTVRANQSCLQQLVENLMRNAIEHGGKSGSVTVGELPDGFFVEDDGSGIPEEDRENVFEAGFSTSPDGTGFGLSIVAQVADAHGWDIRSTEGTDGGARFEITGVEFVE